MQIEELKQKLLEDRRYISQLLKLLEAYRRQKLKGAVSNSYRLGELLDKFEQHLSAAVEFLPASMKATLEGWLMDERSEVSKLIEEFRLRFGAELATALKDRLSLEVSGQYPRLYAGSYTIELDFERGYCAIYWGPEFIKKVNLSVDGIIKTIEQTEQKLKGKRFDEVAFWVNLKAAYRRLLKLKGKPDGERLPIIEVLGELAFLLQDKKFKIDPRRNNFRDYSRLQFGYDLARLRDKSSLKLYVATFDATVDRKDSIWVPDAENSKTGTRYAYIAIVGELEAKQPMVAEFLK